MPTCLLASIISEIIIRVIPSYAGSGLFFRQTTIKLVLSKASMYVSYVHSFESQLGLPTFLSLAFSNTLCISYLEEFIYVALFYPS